MFDSVRRLLPWAMAAAMALTVTGSAALAQTDEEIAPAAPGINAGTVDGRHAIKSTGNKNKRAGKLMAFAASGYLPTNIVQGGVATVATLQSAVGAVNEADNPVHWNQLQGVPPAVVAGDTTVTVLGPTVTIPGGASSGLVIAYPASMNVVYELYPVTPGGAIVTQGDLIVRSGDSAQIQKLVTFVNFSAATAVTVGVRLTAFNMSYISPAKVKDLVTAKFMDRLPKKYRR